MPAAHFNPLERIPPCSSCFEAPPAEDESWPYFEDVSSEQGPRWVRVKIRPPSPSRLYPVCSVQACPGGGARLSRPGGAGIRPISLSSSSLGLRPQMT